MTGTDTEGKANLRCKFQVQLPKHQLQQLNKQPKTIEHNLDRVSLFLLKIKTPHPTEVDYNIQFQTILRPITLL